MDQRPSASVHAHHHAVKFYGTDQSLFTTVSGFLSEGLVNGQPALVIATPAHRDGIVASLASRLIDVVQAERNGDLMLLDAQETLAAFMNGDAPDPVLFEQKVGGLIDRVLAGRPRTILRAYGEMVDVLWREGRSDAAITLEMLWNKLAGTRGFALLCGYSMGQFYKQIEHFQEVCSQHTQVLDPETNVIPFEAAKARTAS